MTIGHFIWTDLSTYDMATARSDYAQFFEWSFSHDAAYDFASCEGRETAAVFPMPERLSKINMPSFWMSYVHVEDLDKAVAKARSHEGVIIEVEPQDFSEDARIALVRDPSGAGFTLYEGPEIVQGTSSPGQVVARYHHLPDVKLIETFYAVLFGWRFEKAQEKPWPVYDILHPDGAVVAQVEEVPESIRGKYRYWMPCFGVRSTQDMIRKVEARGGMFHQELPDHRAMVADRQGAHFMIQALPHHDPKGEETRHPVRHSAERRIAWRSMVGLVCVWCAVFFDLELFWGVLFLIWLWPALRTGQADFVEVIDRRSQPVMYWLIVGTWSILSLWLVFAALANST